MSGAAWGRKVGMTQVFDGDKVVPVTAIDVRNWVVTGVRTREKNGYSALQVGLIKTRHVKDSFSSEWLKKPGKYFSALREIRVSEDPVEVTIGQNPATYGQFAKGDAIDVAGKTRGRGFAGVVRRHDFNGPPGSHGSTMGKRPGSLSFMCSQGRVIKGKKMPGHYGNTARTVQGMRVVQTGEDTGVLLVKGAVPGHKGSFVFVSKSVRSG